MFPFGAMANSVVVSPSIIDETAKARDIFKYKIKIKNNKENKVDLYAAVSDIVEGAGIQGVVSPSSLSRESSLAKWILIKRGRLEVEAGGEIEVDLEIKVNMSALPGKYHAVIGFAEASNRSQANSKLRTSPQVFINMEVKDEIVEKAQLIEFVSEKNMFTAYPAKLSLEIKNLGNSYVNPKGSVYIYDRRNTLVGQVEANPENEEIKPEQSKVFKIDWSHDQGKMGRYKARMEVEYGNKSIRDLQETVYFFVFPVRYMIIFGVGLFLITFLLTYILLKKMHVKNRHLNHRVAEYREQETREIINLKK